jgi:hypothetical protein
VARYLRLGPTCNASTSPTPTWPTAAASACRRALRAGVELGGDRDAARAQELR